MVLELSTKKRTIPIVRCPNRLANTSRHAQLNLIWIPGAVFFNKTPSTKWRANMLKSIKLSAMAVLAFVAYSQPGMAREFADIYTECGIGAIIAPRNAAVAAVTNVTWDSGTTAISSNISSPSTCAGGKETIASFIHDSYDSLEKDLASGNGPYLDTLMVLAGYDSQAKQELTQTLRNDFATLVADSSYTDQSRFKKAEALYDLVYNHVDEIS